MSYAETTRDARRRGIIVNTVQCGSDPGTAPVWREIAALATGQYATIAQDGGMRAMTAPMDEELTRLAYLSK